MNWRSVENVDQNGASASPEFQYICSQDNPALRSCARENVIVAGGHQHQVYHGCPAVAAVGRRATVDVEDLGKCFEEHNVNYPTVHHGRVTNGGKILARSVYRGVKNGRDVISTRKNHQENVIAVSPAARTWSNIKEAFFENEDQQRTETGNNEITESNDGHFSSRIMANSRQLASDRYHYNHSPKWRPALNHPGYFDQDFNWFDHGGGNVHHDFEKSWPPIGQHPSRIDQTYAFPHHTISQDKRNYNFCTEEQWLRCPAPQCPTFMDGNYTDFGNGILPCMDQSSELNFYYGEDIGYLTPAEYLKFEEDSISNEKRKEKSRDAARCRRSRETNIFTELGKALPVPEEQAEHLDKASVMRLAIAYLKVRTVIDAIPEPLAKPEPSPEMDGLFLKALDGFMIVLSSDGDMVYLSENVSEYLGVSQMDMMGQNVYDYSHPCDHDELRECLSMKPSNSTLSIPDEKQTCNLFLRLKCTLTSKGRKVNLKSASYKVIHCTGHVVVTPRDLSTPATENEDNEDGVSEGNDEPEDKEKVEKGAGACLVMVGCPVPHPSNIEAPLGRYTFLSKHSLNMKFTYADEKLAEYLGWDINELVGQSVFEFHHALDNLLLDKSFKSLFSKGQCETAPYRFLGKKGGYVWVVTQATLIHCAKQHKPLSVVCVNYIISGIECENEVYSTRQLEARSVDVKSADNILIQDHPVSVLATVAILKRNKNKEEIEIENEDIKLQDETSSSSADRKNNDIFIPLPILERPRPLSVTASLFRTHEKPQREVFASKKAIDPQKEDILFAKPISNTGKLFDRKNTKKENLPAVVVNSSLALNQPEHLFQGKPIKYFNNEVQRVRPQVVTRSLFAPAPQIQEPPSRPPPLTATASIFAPRTEDMNKGFLTFSEDQPGLTMLKDEPEDLTHLAPTPGDVCVPLEDTPFLSDMLDDFILGNDNYCPLLSPGLPNELRASDLGESLKDSDLEESLRSSELGESLADSDPFMYRDSPSSCSGSPNLLSPALSKSPGSIDSLCSPSGSGGGLSEDEMLMLSIGDVLADEELALRAPYIPMSDQDETLQLFISNDMVMWPQPPDKKSKWSNEINDNSESSNVGSSLEQLLRDNSSGNVNKKCNDHGGGLVDPTDALGSIYKNNGKEENTSWQSKSDRTQKRLHCSTTTSLSSFDNDIKRLKCSDQVDVNCCDASDVIGNSNLNNNNSNNNNNNNNNNNKGNLTTRGGNLNVNINLNLSSSSSSRNAGSQLLQQLMSQQSPSKNRNDISSNGGDSGCGNVNLNVNGNNVSCRLNDAASNIAQQQQQQQQRQHNNNQQQQQQQQQSNSVLMNLLVSGCDGVIDPRNIPPLSQLKMSPLSVDLDHQMVPRLASEVALQHLSPDTRNELVNSIPTARNDKLNSPQELEPMDFDNFGFDVSPLSFELLQGSDLLKIPSNNLV